MKTLLQQVATGRYLKNQGAWTLREESARAFTSSLAALEFCTDHGLADVEIVLKFSDSRYDIRLQPFEKSAARPSCRSTGTAKTDGPGSRAPSVAGAFG